MIEAGEFVDFEMFVVGLFQGLADRSKILLRQNLLVFFAVEDQHGTGYSAQCDGGIVGQKIAEPGRSELLDLQANLRFGNIACHLFSQLFFERGIVFFGRDSFGFDQREHFFFFGGMFGGFFGLGAAGDSNGFALRDQNLISGDAGAGHHHDESDVRVAGGDHGGDHGAFAVADQSNFVGIDFGAGLEVGDAGFGVGGEVGGGGGLEIASRFGGAAIVGAKYGDAVTGEIVGENQEWFVAEQGLVAILRAGTGDEHDCGKRTLALRNGESRGQRDVLNFVFVSDVFVAIGIGLHRILWTFGLERGFIFYRFQYQGQRVARLGPLAVDGRFVGGDSAFVDAVELVGL